MDICCPKCKKYNLIDMNGNRICTYCKHSEVKKAFFVSAITKSDAINETSQTLTVKADVEAEGSLKSYTEEEWKKLNPTSSES